MKSSTRNTSPDLSHTDNVFQKPNALLPDRNHYDNNGFHTPEALMASSYEELPPLHETRQGVDSQSCPRSLLVPLFLDLVIPRIDGTTPRNVEHFELLPRPSKIGFLPGMSKFYTSSNHDQERNIPSPRIFTDKNGVDDIQSQVVSSFQPQVFGHQMCHGQEHRRPIPTRPSDRGTSSDSTSSTFRRSSIVSVKSWSPDELSAFERVLGPKTSMWPMIHSSCLPQSHF